MNSFRIRFEGPSLLALQIATELADADGVELTSSQRPSPLGGGTARLEVVVAGEREGVVRAVEELRRSLPLGASLDLLDD